MKRSLIQAVQLPAILVILGGGMQAGAQDNRRTTPVVDWTLDRLASIGGHPTNVVGAPVVVAAAEGGGIAFDGVDDGIFLDVNPLARLSQFTVEVIFRPAAGGPKEQRFLHFQEAGSENRLLFETRLTPDGRWFLDTFLKVGDGNHTLFADRWLHELGPWYAAAVVVDGETMRHYVNGQPELAMPIQLQPLGAGKMSFGVRINQVSWYKGTIRRVRVTPRALASDELLRP